LQLHPWSSRVKEFQTPLLQDVPSLVNERILQYALVLAVDWADEDHWDKVMMASPGFGASICLHALAQILRKWMEGTQTVAIFSQVVGRG